MLAFLSNNYLVFNDLAQPWQLGFQDGASPGFTGIVELHDTIFYYLVIISVGVFWLLGSIIYFYNSNKTHMIHKYLNHGLKAKGLKTINQQSRRFSLLQGARSDKSPCLKEGKLNKENILE